MKKKIINGFLMVALLVASVGSFVSCKDYEEDNYSDLLGKHASLAELVENQRKALQDQIEDLDSLQKQCKEDCIKAREEMQKKYEADTAAHGVEYRALLDRVIALEGFDKTIDGLINDAKEQLRKDISDSLTIVIQNFNTELSKQENAIKTWADTTFVTDSELEQKIQEFCKKAECNCEALNTWMNDWKTTFGDATTLNERIKKLEGASLSGGMTQDSVQIIINQYLQQEGNATINEIINKFIQEGAGNTYITQQIGASKEYSDSLYQKAIAYINLQTGALNSKLNTLNATVADLEEAYKAADKELQDQIDAIKADVEALEDRVAANEQAIANLTDALKKQITGIIIQGTNNPIFGSFALPINLQSNVLAAYYGYAGSQGVTFPALRPRYYVDPDNVVLTEKDLEMLGVEEAELVESGALILGDEGNAGKVYLTINPNTVDFTGVELPLVNSLDENAGVKLSGLVKSDHKLSFGYDTRANNGFYEAKASVNPSDIENVKLKINFGELKEVAKDIVNGNGINVSNVAKTVANQLSAFKMDANGVKASWNDAYGEHSVYSQYAIAATAIKPLSMSFGKDFNFKKVPGVDKAERFIGRISDKVFNKINSAIPDFSGLNFVAPQIKKIEIPTLNPDSFKITINIETIVEYELNMTVDVEDVVINDMNGTTESITVTVPKKEHEIHVQRYVYAYQMDTSGNYVYDANGKPIKADSVWLDEIETIEMPEYTIDVPATNFTVKGQVVEIKDVLVKKQLEIPVSFTHVEDIYPIINSLYSDIVGPIEDVNVMLEDLEAFMDDVNKMLDELNKIKDITNTLDNLNDNIKEQVAKYLDKFNAKFCNLINSTNKALRPVMLIKTADGFSKVSQAYNAPTRISGTAATLVATSYTAEVLAPSYKKLVGVTNVIKNGASAKAGNSECKSVLDEVNSGDLATVVDGGQIKFYANFKKGYTYEIVYTAVDYHGLVDAKKFYVTCE